MFQFGCWQLGVHFPVAILKTLVEQETLKNVGPICYCEPPHAAVLHCHSPGVATVARRLRYSYSYRCPQQPTTTTTTTRDRGDRYGSMEWAQISDISLQHFSPHILEAITAIATTLCVGRRHAKLGINVRCLCSI